MSDDLFHNHLLFMATHRGSVRLRGRDVWVEGPTPDLCSFVPGGEGAAIPGDNTAVRLAPWSGIAWRDYLPTVGFGPAEALNYMELADSRRSLSANGITVTRVSDRAGAEAFARIQAEGFATGEPDVDDWWRPYFAEQARANYDHPAQCFYLGWCEDRPVTSTLVLRTPGMAGIYAVATLPEFRKRGISAAVLEQAWDPLESTCRHASLSIL